VTRAPLRLEESAKTAMLSVTHAPIGHGGPNWVTRSKPGNTGQLPAYIQNVRNAIMRSGADESRATAIAVGRIRDWAEGKGKVSPEVRAAAAKAIAEWEAMRARSHAKSAVKEAARVPLRLAPVAEDFNPAELRNFLGRWMRGGAVHHTELSTIHPARPMHPSELPPASVAKRSLAALTPEHRVPVRVKTSTGERSKYAGGLQRMSQATAHALRGVFTPTERASKRKPVQPVGAPRSKADVEAVADRLLAMAPAQKHAFDSILSQVARKLGSDATASVQGRPTFEEHIDALRNHPDQTRVILGPIKSKARLLDKANRGTGDYIDHNGVGHPERVTDVVRSTVVVPHVDKLADVVKAVRDSLPTGWSILKPKNRYAREEPGVRGDKVNSGPLPGGYADVSMLVRSPNGYLHELQINTAPMWLAKEAGPGHNLYVETQTLEREIKTLEREGKQPSAAQLRKRLYLIRKQLEVYGPAMVRATSPVSRKIPDVRPVSLRVVQPTSPLHPGARG
jgi:hypothetical protein